MARTEIPLVILHPETGDFVENAAVVINKRPSGAGTVYTNETGETTLTQPLASDAQGRVTGWVDRGKYSATIVLTGFSDTVVNFDSAPGGDSSITTAWIADDSVTNEKISNEAVSTLQLADEAVTTNKLAVAAISSDRLVDGAVTLIKLAGNSVDATRLKADASIDSNRAVTTNHIRNLAIVEGKLANVAVTTAKLGDLAVTSGKLADAAVTSSKLGPGSVASSHIQDNAISNAKLPNGVISTSKLADVSVSTGKLNDKAVTSAKLADDSVGGLALAPGVVSPNHIAPYTFTPVNVTGDDTPFTGYTIEQDTWMTCLQASGVTAGQYLFFGAVTAAQFEQGSTLTFEIRALAGFVEVVRSRQKTSSFPSTSGQRASITHFFCHPFTLASTTSLTIQGRVNVLLTDSHVLDTSHSRGYLVRLA